VLNDLKRIIAFSTISQLGYYSILILTIFFILLETTVINGFYFYNKFIYINYDIAVLALGPFFITNILHIPKKRSNFNKSDLIEDIKDNLSSSLYNVYNDFSYNGRST
jgi:NADH:ubiquinone oxidoreductase subunit 2 (subunit N)